MPPGLRRFARWRLAARLVRRGAARRDGLRFAGAWLAVRFRFREAFSAAFCRLEPKIAICFGESFRFGFRFFLRAGLTSVRFLWTSAMKASLYCEFELGRST
jgi:hypothetical protein